MKHFSPVCVLTLLVLSGLWSAAACAEEAYFDIPIDHLTFTDGKLPVNHAAEDWRIYGFREMLRTYVVLDGAGEAFAVNGFENRFVNAPVNHVVIHTPNAGDVTGHLYVENADSTGMVKLAFKVPASAADPAAKTSFYRIMEEHYEYLMQQGVPGAAWFRHRAREARHALGGKDDDVNQRGRWNRPATLDDTYSLFSGNQALAENLQLAKALPPGSARAGGKDVAVDSLQGIKVAEMDWKAVLKDKNPKTDLLAAAIPADQHAIFFPSFAEMIALADEADRSGTPVLQVVEPRSQDSGTRVRYERQLGLSLTGIGRMLGPHLVNSIAVTGSDPYLRAGSDLAILFEPKDSDALVALLTTQLGAARQMTPDSQEVEGNAGSLHYKASLSPSRTLSSYLAVLKNGTVVISNSEAQLARIAAVQDGKAAPMSQAQDYLFFRDRYKIGEGDESALIVLTDATIRRWCSARWRIGDSRRTRAAAVLADLDARHLDRLVAGHADAEIIVSEFSVPDLGDIHLKPHGAVSSTYGSLGFMTPIVEMKLDTVTEGEAEAYKRWRDSYETNWRGVFDPIAIRFSVREKKLAADVTVRPLIWSSEYRTIVNIASGAKIDPASSDPHDALFRAGMAININSAEIKAASAFAMSMAPNVKVDPLGWVGQSIWIYADDDPFWGELLKAEKPEEFWEKNLARTPVGLQVEVSNGFKLTAFLVALHGFIDQSAPGMTLWENLNYKDQPYVKISPSEQAKGQNKELNNAALYYRATGSTLLLTPNEALLKRSIDRQLQRDEAKKAGKEIPVAGQPVLGESLVWQLDSRVYDIFERSMRDQFQRYMQQQSWNNLAILNEWKRRYPDQDPVKLYQRFFHTTLIDPAGGQYTFSEKWQTMESTVYGCPAEPKKGPDGIAALTGLLRANLGLTFESDGLRARAEVDRAGK